LSSVRYTDLPALHPFPTRRSSDLPELARVVMLAPPNKGSEVVDWLKHAPGFGLINGPAGKELGTDKNSLPNTLGKVDFELGVIRSEEHTSELQSREKLVCRLLLDK